MIQKCAYLNFNLAAFVIFWAYKLHTRSKYTRKSLKTESKKIKISNQILKVIRTIKNMSQLLIKTKIKLGKISILAFALSCKLMS